MRRGTGRLPLSLKGWLAFLAQFALIIGALVSLVAAVPQTRSTVDRVGWDKAEGAVTRVEPHFDLGMLGSLFGAGLPTPVAYEVTVSTTDGLLSVVVPENLSIGQPLTVYFDPDSRETSLEAPWLPASKAAAAIAMTSLLTAGWWMIERSTRKARQSSPPIQPAQTSTRQVVPQETRDSGPDAAPAGGQSKAGARQSGRPGWLLAAVFVALFIVAFVFVRIGMSTDPAPLGVAGGLLTYATAVALLVVSFARRRMIPALITASAMVVPVTAFYIGERLYGPCFILWCQESEDLFYAWGIPLSLVLQTLALILVSRPTSRVPANPRIHPSGGPTHS